MKPFYFDPAQHESAIDDATTVAAARLTCAILDREPAATSLICECVATMLEDEQALADLVRNTVCGTSNIGRLIYDVIRTEAERIATDEVEAAARQRYDDTVEQMVDAAMEAA